METYERKNMKFVRYDIFSYKTGVKLACLPYSDLVERDVTNMNLVFADLRQRDLHGSNFSGSNLTHADLRGCDLTDCDFTDCYTIGCRFDGAKLSGTKGLNRIKNDSEGKSGFYRASWRGCDFSEVSTDWVERSNIMDRMFEGCIGI